MTKAAALVVSFICVFVTVAAESYTWSGAAGNHHYDNAANWVPTGVPGADDDATIESGAVELNSAVAVGTITLGSAYGGSTNLTVFAQLTIKKRMDVLRTGILTVNGGDASVSGVIGLDGTLSLIAGSISGNWSGSGKLDFTSPSQKVVTACNMDLRGTSVFSGSLRLQERSRLTLRAPVTVLGRFFLLRDLSDVMLDSTSTMLSFSGTEFSVESPASFGLVVLLVGNVSIHDHVSVAKTLYIPTGSYVTTLGNVDATFTGGVSGSGILSLQGNSVIGPTSNMGGQINAWSGSVVFSSTANVSSLTICGATTTFSMPVTADELKLFSGTIQGGGSVTANRGTISSEGITINTQVEYGGFVSGQGSLLAFGPSGKVIFRPTATFSLRGAMHLTGSSSGSFTNNGAFNAYGDLAVEYVSFLGSGNVTVKTTVNLTHTTFKQSQVTLNSGSALFTGVDATLNDVGKINAFSQNWVKGAIGAYQFFCFPDCLHVSTTASTPIGFNFTAATPFGGKQHRLSG